MNRLVVAVVVAFAAIGQAAADDVGDATRAGDLATVERLLAGGAAVDEPGQNGETPLIVAALIGREDIAALLLGPWGGRSGAQCGRVHPAARRGLFRERIRRVAAAEAKGAALEDTSNKAHASPLMVAADEGRAAVAELFIARAPT